MRESPALDVIHLLRQRGARVTYSDPYVPVLPAMEGSGEPLRAEELEPAISAADAVVIITDHASFDYQAVAERSRLVIDTRNALKNLKRSNIVRL